MTQHPVLPAGYNADDNNGDEVDGAGTNWLIAPLLFDTFVGLKPLVITAEMLEVFDTTCPDYVVPADYGPITWPMEQRVLAVGGTWVDLVLPGASNVIVLPRESRGVTIRPEPDTAVISEGDQAQTIRRKA